MHVLHTPRHAHEQAHRRRVSRWAALHAWKLAGLTAIVTFVGVFIAVTLSLILRPTRSYFFPLLSDVYKHQPEGAILRVAMIASTLLFFATTTASFLHCHSLRLFARDRTPPLHDHSDTSLTEFTADILPNTPVVKRRIPRFNSMQLMIAILLGLTLLLTFLQYSGLGDVLLGLFKRQSVRKLAKYLLGLTWMCAMCFLVWYFLQLQHMPDRNSTELPLQDDSSLSENEPNEDAQTAETSQPLTRMRRWLSYLIVMLRPVCLTGQAVCVIKIVGLWLALDTFSIANIRLVKITLLAALAFAEYTAAFFFAFFMSILAVDMRAKASPPDLSG